METKELETGDKTEEIVQQIHSVLNQIFTQEFLESNPLIQSQINNVPLSLPLSAIFQCSQILSVTADQELIQRALETSNSIIVTENLVRPNIKAEQQIIILREVDETVTEEMIKDMFVNSSCPPIVNCRNETNNNWFVSFGSEAEARTALTNIKNLTLGGKTVRARLKTGYLIARIPSGSNNTSPTNRAPPSLVIDEANHSGGAVPVPGMNPYFYPPPMLHMMSPTLPSGQAANTPPPFPSPMYYMYPPPNGYFPHPMHHPMGSPPPMYMGGMWGVPPPYHMMQMSPNMNLSPANQHPGGGGGGAGRGNRTKQQKSPRNLPNQSPSYRSQSSRGGGGGGYREKNTALPVQEGVENENFEENSNSVEARGSDQSLPIEQRKKIVKKKKDRNMDPASGGQDNRPGSNEGTEPFEDKRKKDPNYQNGKSYHSQSTDNYNSSRGKGRDGKERPRANKPPHTAGSKPEHQFNMETDFPSLLIAPSTGGTNSSVTAPVTAPPNGAISWAARISKTAQAAPQVPEEPSSVSKASTEVARTASDQPSELNISFGNVPVPSSSSVDAIILPSPATSSASVVSSHSTTKENKIPPLTSHTHNGDPIILSSSHEQLEYVPISFGAFEATPALPPSSGKAASQTLADKAHLQGPPTTSTHMNFVDIVRRGGNN